MTTEETPRERYLRQKREAAARWRAAHPEEYRQTLARYRTANKEQLGQSSREAKKRSYAANVEKERTAARGRYRANITAGRNRARQYAADNPEANKSRARAWREANPDRVAELSAKGRERRKERWVEFLEQERERYRKGYELDGGKYTAKGAARRTARLRATPPWSDLAAIVDIYRRARQLSLDTGIKHDVDHIIPLRGKHVSGLHVPNNLQILTSAANRRKHIKVAL